MKLTVNTKVTCMFKYFSYLHWAQELQAEVENLLQFVLAGQLYGKLTPTLIRPDLLRKFINRQSTVNSKILSRYPNMLYSSAMASLLNADFENLQFTYLITFPNFGNDPIYPYLTVKQNGFWAEIPHSNEIACLMFRMPQTAIIHDRKLYALKNALNCPDFGNVRICDRSQFDMIPMSDCLNLNAYSNDTRNFDYEGISHCQLTQCMGNLKNNDVYLSSSSGLLVRTTSPKIDIVYDQPQHQLDLYVSAMIKTIETPESGSVFIPWHENISAVTFAKQVVYSPINANHQVRLRISPDDEIAKLDINSFLSIPSAGTVRISQLIKEQEQRIEQLENQIEPSVSSVKKWASDTFAIPLWLKLIIFIAFAIGALTMGKFVYKTTNKFITKVRSSRNQDQSNTHHYMSDQLANNTLYPHLPHVHGMNQPPTLPPHEPPHVPVITCMPTAPAAVSAMPANSAVNTTGTPANPRMLSAFGAGTM